MNELHSEKIWDLTTRLWHWVFAIAITTGWTLGKFMAFETIDWHFYTGYFILSLLLFRIVRGFIGPKAIRFSALIPSYKETVNYLSNLSSRNPSGTPGHNPLGSLSVIAMLCIIAAQAMSGLFVESDDFFEYGPLAEYVSQSVVSQMTWWHHTFADVIFILVGLHLLAIIYYLIWKRENLIKPMINGWKQVK